MKSITEILGEKLGEELKNLNWLADHGSESLGLQVAFLRGMQATIGSLSLSTDNREDISTYMQMNRLVDDAIANAYERNKNGGRA